jgi:hypothetical protein
MVTRRNKIPIQNGESENVATPMETLTERRQRWSGLLQHYHYQAVISEVLDEELPKYDNSTVINTIDRSPHVRECALILASTSLVFSAAVEGNLVSRLSTDANLQKECTVIRERAHTQPSIYIHLLTDQLGNAPSPNQYMAIRSIVQDYLAEGSTSKHACDGQYHPTHSK